MKVSDLLVLIRKKLNDVAEPYLWSDDELIECYEDTIIDVYNALPIVDTDFVIVPDTGKNADVVFDDLPLLKAGILYRAYLKQDSDIFDRMAIQVMKQEYIERLQLYKHRFVRNTNEFSTTPVHQGLL